MATSRSQLSEQIRQLQGGGTPLGLPQNLQQSVGDALAVDTNQLRADVGLESREQERLNELRAMLAQQGASQAEDPFDFQASFDKYTQRLTPFFADSPRPTLFDLASDIGAAMLSADPTAGAFRSAGAGFVNFNERLRKFQEGQRLLNRQIGLQALQMASADERAATDFINKKELEEIKLRAKPYDPLIYEVPDPDGGEPKRIEVDPRNPYEVAAIRKIPGATQIRLPESEINIDSRQIPETTTDKKSAESLVALEAQWADDARSATAANQMTGSFLYVLTELGPEGFGAAQAATLGPRKILDDLGIIYDKNLDKQIMADTLGTRIAMALVGQTKGAISNAEMNLFLAASPTLASTYQGAIEQASLLQRISNLSIQKAEAWAKATAGGILDEAKTPADALRIARAWELKWSKENPFLTPEQTNKLRGLAEKETPAARALRTALRPETSADEGLVTDFSG
jgi:hypothetical protein